MFSNKDLVRLIIPLIIEQMLTVTLGLADSIMTANVGEEAVKSSLCSVVLGKWMGLGVFGVWVAMTLDWVFRGILFVKRYIQGKWQRMALI